ncbi:MAG: hypothetical protein WCD79_02635 [Chthoniobacteraceae bacterium]
MPNASKIIHLVGYGVYLACTRVAKLLPLKLVFSAGEQLGFFGYRVLRGRRRVAIENIMLALKKSESDASELARKHFGNLGANMLSALKIATMSDEEILECVTLDIPPELEKRAKEGKDKSGWVAMISHMGNWEILSHLSPIFPHYKYGAIYHKLANDYVDRHFKVTRARSGVTLFDRREGYLKCAAFLRSGGAVGVLVDQYAGLPGTWMPFFKRLTSTSTLAALLAQRANVDIIPISINTIGTAKWHVTISMPIPRDNDVEILTARINEELEKEIEASPADWLWSHNRWKTPRWMFLFTKNGRRVFYPPDFDPASLIPYRIMIRSPEDLEEAKASAVAALAIKRGRPDAYLTIVAPEALETFWKDAEGIDEVLAFGPEESVRDVAQKIKGLGRFDVGILFSKTFRAALETWRGGVPYRIGPPHRFLLNDWANSQGLEDPPENGPGRYKRIAEAIGAVMPD